MCYTIYMPIVCTLQMISRVIIACLFAIEDLIRMCIHTVHSYVSIVLQCCSFLPMCLALCCMKQCYTSGICTVGCSPKFSSIICGYGAVIVVILFILLLIFYLTDWFEIFFMDVGLDPCSLFRKLKSNACQLIHGVSLNSSYSDHILYTTNRNHITTRTTEIDKYRKNQSDGHEYYYDNIQTSKQQLVNALTILSKTECTEKEVQVSSKLRRYKSTTLPDIIYSTNLLDYHKSVFIKRLKRYKVLEKALSKEININPTY